jgi:succinyl-CoA synthetase alpha subunit
MNTVDQRPIAVETGAPALRILVFPNTYRDSVELMRVAAQLEGVPGVTRAGVVMATPANQAVLADAGLLANEARAAGPNDLVVAIAGTDVGVEPASSLARQLLAGQAAPRHDRRGPTTPRTLAEATAAVRDSRLALISVPGTYASAEAFKALKRGLHVFMFSDNVPVEDEIALKHLARRKGLLMMGPDCGTAILDGIPLGFANAVRRGPISIVAASGTGLQQVACLVDRAGVGLSQAIGVGGRDLDERVGGPMMLAGIDRLAADSATRVLVLLSKPPAPSVANRVLDAARATGKPVIVNFLGAEADVRQDGNLVHVPTLEDAARWAIARVHDAGAPPTSSMTDQDRGWATEEARHFRPGQSRIRGLYSGGTLAKEATLLLRRLLPGRGEDIDVIDLGDDEFTVGRPHPMIDYRLRNTHIIEAGQDPRTAVILLDVVLGFGSHMDPAAELGPAIQQAHERAIAAGRSLCVVASVCGTQADPQVLSDQESRLLQAGVTLAPSNAQAARLAALLLQGAPSPSRRGEPQEVAP